MKEDIRKLNHRQEDNETQNTGKNVDHAPTVEPLAVDQELRINNDQENAEDTGPERALALVNMSELNGEQFWAYDIITQHLCDYLQGKTRVLLRMILYGEVGMGKSQVIQTVTETF